MGFRTLSDIVAYIYAYRAAHLGEKPPFVPIYEDDLWDIANLSVLSFSMVSTSGSAGITVYGVPLRRDPPRY